MSEQPGRYQRSASGMVAAMVILLLVIAGYVAFRAITRDNLETPIPTVDYAPVLKQARADKVLLALAPSPMPRGWRATSVRYVAQGDPAWHLGMLTGSGQYVGIDEQQTSPANLAQEFIGEDATPGPAEQIGGQVWISWSDPGGDFGLVREAGRGSTKESILIGGSGTPAEVRQLVRSVS